MAVAEANHQTAKFNSLPNFLAIRYVVKHCVNNVIQSMLITNGEVEINNVYVCHILPALNEYHDRLSITDYLNVTKVSYTLI